MTTHERARAAMVEIASGTDDDDWYGDEYETETDAQHRALVRERQATLARAKLRARVEKALGVTT